MKLASLFTGIGGIDLGFIQAGFEVVWSNEYDRDAAKTYRYNFPTANLVERDIRKVDAKEIPDFDVLVAGFPCQPFSIVGRQKGFDDPRGNLFFEIARVVDVKRPRIIFLENVENLVNHDSGKTFLVIYNTLASFGYCVKYRVMDSQEYGNIPQRRRRIFIVAFLDYEDCKRFVFPGTIPLTCGLNDLINRSEEQRQDFYYDDLSPYYSRMLAVVKDKNALYKINDRGLSSKPYYICPTLLANMGTMPDRVPIILDDYGIRKITPTECLKLQGFPSWYKFPDIPIKSAYKQCGNSVVVPIIKRIAEHLISLES